jgi:hypothetical protein
MTTLNVAGTCPFNREGECTRLKRACACGLQKTEVAVDNRVPALRPAIIDPLLKTCRTCGVEKVNSFRNFGKKLRGNRRDCTTVDVCKACASEAIRAGIRGNWRHR